MLRRDLLENLPNIPKRGLLRRLILQAPKEGFASWIEIAMDKEEIEIPWDFWRMMLDFEHDIEEKR